MQITPFRSDGSVDLEGLSAIVEWQAQLGVTSLSALGMAGEFYKLATDEVEAVISTVTAASGDVRTLVGVSAGSAEVAARLAPPRRISRRGRPAGAAAATASSRAPTTWSSTTGRSRRHQTCRSWFRTDRTRSARWSRSTCSCGCAAKSRRSSTSRSRTSRPAPRSPPWARPSAIASRCSAEAADWTCAEAYDRGAVGCISGAATADLFVEFDRLYHTDREATDRRYHELLPLIQYQCQSAELFVASEKYILAQRFPISETVRRPGYVLDDRQRAVLESAYLKASNGSKVG